MRIRSHLSKENRRFGGVEKGGCARFFDKYDCTIGQMEQAARSGKQNIAEASMASAHSKETEIKLTNVACFVANHRHEHQQRLAKNTNVAY